MGKQLNSGDRHLLHLVRQGQDADGWAKVSEQVMPLVQALPPELVTLDVAGGRVRLTDDGNVLLDWS
jgi:hypothetical protein